MSLKDDLNEKKEELSKKMDNTKENISEEYQEAKEKLGEEIDEAKEVLNEKFDAASEAMSSTMKTGVKKTKSFFKWLFALIILVLVLGAAGYLLYCNWEYSDGTRAGNLIKVSKKGYVFKTYEGQLNMGGIQGNVDGTLGSIWNFSLTDDELYKELEAVQGKKVMLRYKEINKAMPWQGETNYFIYDVEVKE